MAKKQDKVAFTGTARSVECYFNQGHNNFKIVTLQIEDGIVISMTKSDPYASFEAIAKMTEWNENAVIHLNSHWQNGKTLSK